MKANNYWAFLLVFAFCGICSIASGALAQNVNTNIANLTNVSENRVNKPANSSKDNSSNTNNQNAPTNKIANALTNSANSIENTSGQTINSNGSNSNTVANTKEIESPQTIEFSWFKIAGFPFWFNILVLVILGGGFVYLTFWHVPDRIKNLSGEKIMKFSILGVILLVLTLGFLNIYFAQSTEQSNTNSATPTQKPKPTPTEMATSSTTATPNPTASNSATPNPTASASPDPAQNKPSGTPELPSLLVVKVTDVKNAKDKSNSAGIGESIVLTVANLKNLKNFADCLSTYDMPVAGCTKQKVALFLNGREIKDTYPEWIKPDSNEVGFHLQRSPDSDEAWADLLGAPPSPFSSNFYEKPNVSVNVGLKDSYALGGSSDQISLRRTSRGWFILGVLFLIALLIAILVLAIYSDILRNQGLSPEGQMTGWKFKKKARKPYSLARCQMAFWFVFVIGAFVFIWLITGASDTITTTALSLIGIGAGTALGAAVIDMSSSDSSAINEHKKLKNQEKQLDDEKTVLGDQITALDDQIKNAAETDVALLKTQVSLLKTQKKEKEDLLKTVRASITELQSQVKTSKAFLTDILRDDNGEVSFHRFQMFIWTIVLGILFLHSVWYRLSMPEFGGTLIALLGISAGTYLGFKIPENKPAPEQ